MKKVFSIFLTLLVVGMLCGCVRDAANTDLKETVSDNHVEHQQETIPLNTEAVYDENKVMFMAQDRYDIEGDRYEVYRYNYEGELLEDQKVAAFAGIFPENILVPALDPASEKVGFVDRDGVFVISPQYDDASLFSDDGIAVVCIDDLWGAIDTTGAEIIPCSYYYLSSFFESGYAVFGVSDGEYGERYGILNSSGEVVVEEIEDRFAYVFDGYYCTVDFHLNHHIGEGYFISVYSIFDFSGAEIDRTEFLMRDENDENKSTTQYYLISGNEIYKYSVKYDTRSYAGNVIKTELFDGKQFCEIEKEYQLSYKQVATTGTGNGYGMTVNGETVIPFQYDQIHPIGNYFVAVVWDPVTNTQILDIYDSNYTLTASDLEYSVDQPWGKSQTLPDGYFCIYKTVDDESLYGIIDYQGNVIVEPQFYRGIHYCTYENLAMFPWN